MNKLFTKRLGALISSLLFISSVSFSQFENVDFLRSAPADGVKLIQAYVSPWANAFGAGLNGGWYNTAKPHKLGGFDITTGFSIGIVPSSDQTFDVSKIVSSSLSLTGTGLAPTIAGANNSGPLMTYKDNVSGVTLSSFKTPPGTSWKAMPVPDLQVGIGLPFGTELKARFIPKISIKDGNISLWGVGIVHSLLQYLPGNKLLPFDVSLFAGYTKLQGNVHMSLQPDPLTAQVYTAPYTSTFSNQNLNLTVEALNVSAIASLNLPVVTFYGGLGYSKTKTGMSLSGDFPTPVYVTTPLPGHVEYNNSGVKKGSDFQNMDIKNFSGLRANIGIRFKLAIITIHADYTRAQYNVISTGLGFSFR
jgi:hypothetical protein